MTSPFVFCISLVPDRFLLRRCAGHGIMWCSGLSAFLLYPTGSPRFPLGLKALEKWEGIFQSENFEQTGKVRENHTKYWKTQGIWDKYYLKKKKKTLKKILEKWQKVLEKSGNFFSLKKVGTLFPPRRYAGRGTMWCGGLTAFLLYPTGSCWDAVQGTGLCDVAVHSEPDSHPQGHLDGREGAGGGGEGDSWADGAT